MVNDDFNLRKGYEFASVNDIIAAIESLTNYVLGEKKTYLEQAELVNKFKDTFDCPNEIREHIFFFIEFIDQTILEFNQVNIELESGVREQHVDTFEAIFTLSKRYENRYFEFKKHYKLLKDSDDYYARSLIDKIYGTTRSLVDSLAFEVGNLMSRLRRLSIRENDSPTKHIGVSKLSGYGRENQLKKGDFNNDLTFLKKQKIIKIKESLPYIGEPKKDGTIYFYGVKIERPDYTAFKSKKINLASDCYGILLGLSTPSFELMRNSCESLDMNPWREDDKAYDVIQQTSEEWKVFFKIIQNILLDLNLAGKAKYLTKFDHRQNKPDYNCGSVILHFEWGESSYETLPFLKWAKESGYAIPEELSFVEGEDGLLQWTDAIVGDDMKSKKINNSSSLTGKEKQEFGRLKIEKTTMDSTVKAAVNVGEYIHKAKMEDRLIVKNEIIDLINSIDLKIPNTRIDLIWKSIPENIKSGPGRPKKA